MSNRVLCEQIVASLNELNWKERIAGLSSFSSNSITFSTSFGLEDQVITHLISKESIPIKLFSIDTGRLFEETHHVFQQTRAKYEKVNIDTFYPDAFASQELVKSQGINGFFDGAEERRKCCHVRKVEPLNRALKGTQIWISGLRREHSENRGELPVAEYDILRNLVKVYPLIDVSEATLRSYISENEIPYNALHDQGFPSIGCAPCTRAIEPGEHPRAGRWWWEQESAQECGLHMVNGKYQTGSTISEDKK